MCWNKQTTHFNPASVAWRDEFAPNVEHLELIGSKDPSWSLNLLQSIKNMRTFAAIQIPNILFSHPVSGPFVWPELSRLLLEEVNCHASQLATFLEAHKHSLIDLELEAVALDRGSWKPLLEILLDMPKLGRLILSSLLETIPSTQPTSTFDKTKHLKDDLFDGELLYMEQHCQVCVGVNALLYDFRTHTQPVDYPRDEMYSVYCELALAALEGKVEFRDGECHLLV